MVVQAGQSLSHETIADYQGIKTVAICTLIFNFLVYLLLFGIEQIANLSGPTWQISAPDTSLCEMLRGSEPGD